MVMVIAAVYYGEDDNMVMLICIPAGCDLVEDQEL